MLLKSNLPPLCSDLDEAVLVMADRYVGNFTVSEEAPGSYSELCDWLNTGQDLVVYSGGSDNTIFGSPSVNYAFRAWHDWTHWTCGYDFSLAGEMFTCNQQINNLLNHYSPQKVTTWLPYLTAEVIGQRLYFEKYKEYIVDQRAFVLAYIHNARAALNKKW